MRKQGLFTLVCLLCCLLSTKVVCGQEINGVQKVKQNMALSKEMLQQATTFEYFSDMGTVPQARDCRIIVKNDSVRALMTEGRGMNNVVVCDETFSLMDEQHQRFVDMLADQNIEKLDPSEVHSLGGRVSFIVVRKDADILFSGEERYNLKVTHGQLIDSFLKVLPAEMAKNILIHLQLEYKIETLD